MTLLRCVRLALGGLGLAAIGFGLSGLLTDPYIRDPWGVLRWAVGAVVLHDGVWAPVVFLLGSATVLRRSPVLRGGLLVAAALTAVALPAVLRAGDDHGNATLLPLPYLRNWLLLLAGTAVATAAVALLRHWLAAKSRRRQRE